ncbi:MAG: hypothetical protein K6U11_04290, partial [bacterium]|nr:hypothetical protein [bacterium]
LPNLKKERRERRKKPTVTFFSLYFLSSPLYFQHYFFNMGNICKLYRYSHFYGKLLILSFHYQHFYRHSRESGNPCMVAATLWIPALRGE